MISTYMENKKSKGRPRKEAPVEPVQDNEPKAASLVMQTTNYELFNTLKGNRVVSDNHVRNLVRSISEHNMLSANPIIVNKNFDVIDGQHRLEAARQLGIPVHYVFNDEAALEDIQRLNTVSRAWGLVDYMESHIQRGNRNYVILRDFHRRFGSTLSVSLLLLSSQGELTTDKGLMQKFKRGEFAVKDYHYAEETALRLQEIEPYAEAGIVGDREFIRALSVVYKQVKHDFLMEKLRIHTSKLQRRANIKDYLRQLEDICNYRQKNKFLFI